jgi:putative oxidoreductase
MMVHRNKVVNLLLWLAALSSAMVFLRSGWTKLDGAMIGQFEEWGYTPSFAVAIGFLELAGAVGLLIPRLSGWAALGLSVIMFGAIGTLAMEAEYLAALLPAAMLVLLTLVLFGRGLGLRGRRAAYAPRWTATTGC